MATAAALVFSRVFGLSVVLPNFREHYEGLGSGLAIGVAFGAYGLTMALMQLPSGWLSDKVGRKPMLLVATTFFVLGSLLAGVADNMATLIAGRLLQGMGAISSIAMAAVGETLPAERRTTGMALVGIPAGAGFLLGIGVGPALYPVIDMEGLFFLSAVLGLLAFLPSLGLRFEPPRHAPKGAIPWRPVLALALAGFVSNYALTTTLFYLPTTDWKVLAPLLATAFILVGGVSRMIDKAGWTFGPVAVGLVVVAAAAAGFALLGGIGALLVGGVFFTSHAILQSTLPSQVSRVAGVAGGRGHGIQNVVAYFGTFLAGSIAGWLVPWTGAAFVVLGALAVAAAGNVLLARPKA